MQPVCVPAEHRQRLQQAFHGSQSIFDFLFRQVPTIIPESHLLSVATCKYQFLLLKYQLSLLWQMCYPLLTDEVR